MQVTAFQCPSCKTWVWSRARHDFRTCPCGEISIDGGQHDYHKVSYKNTPPVSKTFEVDCTPEQAVHDWNKAVDELGYLTDKGQHIADCATEEPISGDKPPIKKKE